MIWAEWLASMLIGVLSWCFIRGGESIDLRDEQMRSERSGGPPFASVFR